MISEDIHSWCTLPQHLFNTHLPDNWQLTNEKPHLSFEKRRLVFNYWLSLSSIFTVSTLRVYPSFNAEVFGRIEPSAVYTGASFFISPTLFLQRIHSNHPNLKRVYIVRLFIQNIQCSCGDNKSKPDACIYQIGAENQIELYRMRFCLRCGSNWEWASGQDQCWYRIYRPEMQGFCPFNSLLRFPCFVPAYGFFCSFSYISIRI